MAERYQKPGCFLTLVPLLGLLLVVGLAGL